MFLQTVTMLSRCLRSHGIIKRHIELQKLYVPSILGICRDYHSVKLSANLQLYSNDSALKMKDKNMKLLTRSNRPLVILFSWMMAKENHINKFVKFYTDLNLDVLKVKLLPMQLIKPVTGSQVVAESVIEFLQHSSNQAPVLVHGFSVGGYLFGEVMVKVMSDMKNYGSIIERFTGQIWDSVVDVEGVPVGFPRAVTHNKMLQLYMQRFLEWYLSAAYNMVTVHYRASSDAFHNNTFGMPGLFFFSKSDVVSTVDMNMVVVNKWRSKGSLVTVNCFEESHHVSHYVQHRKVYEAEVLTFLEQIGLIEPSKLRATVS